MVRTNNREQINIRSNFDMNKEASATATASASAAAADDVNPRVLRHRYLNFKNRISDDREDMSRIDSNKFNAIIEEVESLHQHVKNPREQVADAEALLDIANTLVSSVKAHTNEGATPSDLVNSLLKDFGTSNNPDGTVNSINWNNIGLAVSHIFMNASGCSTMVGPMDTELRQRKLTVHKKRTKVTESSRPEELDPNVAEEKTDTDKNMFTMFNILRKNRRVKLEHLVFDRTSYSQTIENVFALSFLTKDGRAEITVDEEGCHFVVPKNAPTATMIQSGEVEFSHFMFQFNYEDWEYMLESVKEGEELMPHRNYVIEEEEEEERQMQTTPIRKISRNRGRVLQEQQIVEDSSESDDAVEARKAAIRKGKRKLIE